MFSGWCSEMADTNTESVADMLPVRIGAVCRDIGLPCLGAEPDHDPDDHHRQANLRFMVLAYTPVGGENLPEAFSGGTRDPAVEAGSITIQNVEDARRFLTLLYYN